MTIYTIDGFWSQRLSGLNSTASINMAGWGFVYQDLPTFVEAPLAGSDGFDKNQDPLSSHVVLVSAPGAVGKTTLARQIAFRTNAVYVDLALADPVGGNTLSGGLVKSGIWSDWQDNKAALLVDGLDEARLKVTQEGFEAFLRDVAEIAQGRSAPTVIFGRTGAVQDAWLVISGKVSTSVLEIGYYDTETALKFATVRLASKNPGNPHHNTACEATKLLLENLRESTTEDGDRFCGYAPVLEAVADHVACEPNPSILISNSQQGAQPVTLTGIVKSILLREKKKLDALHLQDSSLRPILYSESEQMERLASHVYRTPMPSIQNINAKDAQTYSQALLTWVPEHPFLDGNKRPASVVFDAAIAAFALKNHATSEVVSNKELAKGAAANPFIYDFYFSDENSKELPPEHIGIIYSSIRARLSLGDSASLVIEGADDSDDAECLATEVEITIGRAGKDNQRVVSFVSDQLGTVRLGSYVEDIEVTALYSKLEIGPAREATLVAPISVLCEKIVFAAERIIVEGAQDKAECAVMLEASSAEAEKVQSIPILNGGASLSVYWPGAESYPWTGFRSNPTATQDARVDEAL